MKDVLFNLFNEAKEKGMNNATTMTIFWEERDILVDDKLNYLMENLLDLLLSSLKIILFLNNSIFSDMFHELLLNLNFFIVNNLNTSFMANFYKENGAHSENFKNIENNLNDIVCYYEEIRYYHEIEEDQNEENQKE